MDNEEIFGNNWKDLVYLGTNLYLQIGPIMFWTVGSDLWISEK